MTHTEYTTYANKLLELLPEAQAVAMDDSNNLYWFSEIPKINNSTWGDNYVRCGFIGEIQYEGNWEDTLVVKRWVPEIKQSYFYSIIDTSDLYYQLMWQNDIYDQHRLKHNLVFKTKEEAIKRSKELLGIKD